VADRDHRARRPPGGSLVAAVGRRRRGAGLKRLLPGLHLLVGHDHTDYQWKKLVPYLSKGWLDEAERRDLSRYESELFASDGTLRAEALPRFLPDAAGGPVGTVSEAGER